MSEHTLENLTDGDGDKALTDDLSAGVSGGSTTVEGESQLPKQDSSDDSKGKTKVRGELVGSRDDDETARLMELIQKRDDQLAALVLEIQDLRKTLAAVQKEKSERERVPAGQVHVDPPKKEKSAFEQRKRRMTMTHQELIKMHESQPQSSAQALAQAAQLPRIIVQAEPLPTFKGAPDEDILTFLDRFNTYAELQGWDDSRYLYQFRYALSGKAEVMKQKITSYIAANLTMTKDEIREEMISMFPPKQLLREDEILHQLRTIKQGKEERVAMFAARIATLIAQRQDLSTTVARDYFILGLQPKIRTKVQNHEHDDFESARSYAMKVEEELRRAQEVWSEAGRGNSSGTRKSYDRRRSTRGGKNVKWEDNRTETPAQQGTSQVKSSAQTTSTQEQKSAQEKTPFTGTCFNCKQPGHRMKDCPSKRKPSENSKRPRN